MRIGFVQDRTLARLEDGEDDHADEGPDELRQRGEDILDAEVDAGGFAGGGGVKGAVGVMVCIIIIAAVRVGLPAGMFEVEEVGAGGFAGGRLGQTVISGAVGEGGGSSDGEAIDFDAHKGEWSPAGEGPGTREEEHAVRYQAGNAMMGIVGERGEA